MNEICLHCYVSGRVQGVFYRANTCKQAQQLGVTGWVRNLADGRVEVLICGEQQKVEQLHQWLWQGPAAAIVNNVVSEQVAFETHHDFKSR